MIPKSSSERLELRADQVCALNALDRQINYAIIARMGAGKTAIALRDAERLYSAGKIDCLFVTAPPGVTIQWLREQAPKWLRCRYVGFDYRAASSRTKRYISDVNDIIAMRDALLIVVIHFEAFATQGGVEFATWLMRTRRTLWVIDESTKIKNPKAVRTKAIHKIAPHASYRRIMTGTPVTRGVECLWAQYRFLNPDILGRSFYSFRSRYCELEPVWGAPAGAVRIVGYKSLDDLMARIGRYTYQNVGAMPPKTYVTRIVELTPKQRALYDHVSAALARNSPDDPNLDIPNVLAQMTLLQRVLAGHIPSADLGRDVEEIPSNRAAAVVDVIDETMGKVIVWHRFSYDAKLIVDELARKLPNVGVVTYSGRVSPEDRIKAIDSLRSDDNVRVMIAQLQAASHGLDIPQVGTSIYYSGTYDAEVRWQSEDRQRPGLMFPGVYVDLNVPGTIDDDISENNLRKGTTAEFVRRFLEKTRKSDG